MKTIKFVNGILAGAGAVAAGAAIAFMTGFILWEIALRNFFSTSTFMLDIVVGYCVQLSAFASMAYALNHNSHIRVTLVTDRLPERAAYVVELFCVASGILTSAFLIRYVFADGWRSFSRGSMTDTIVPMPAWVPNLICVFGFTLLFLTLFVRLISMIVEKRIPADPAIVQAQG